MLKKIIKYELKGLFRILIPIYLVLLASIVVTGLLHYLDTLMDTPVFLIIEPLSQAVIFLCIVILTGFTALFTAIRFFRTMAGAEGYFSHTIPVSKTTLVIGKNLSGLIVCVASSLVAVLGCALTYFMIPAFHDMYHFSYISIVSIYHQLQPITTPADLVIWSILLILSLLAQSYFNVAMMETAVSLGQIMNKHKVAMSIVFYVAITYGINIIVSVLSVSFSFVNGQTNFMATLANSRYNIYVILIVALTTNLLCSAASNFVTIHMMNHRLNLE